MSVNLYNAETNELELLAGASEIPRWSGTQAEFNALDKDTLADGTIIEITDDLSNIFSTWTGTSAEFEALDKSTLADGCYINITDDSENDVVYTKTSGTLGSEYDYDCEEYKYSDGRLKYIYMLRSKKAFGTGSGGSDMYFSRVSCNIIFNDEFVNVPCASTTYTPLGTSNPWVNCHSESISKNGIGSIMYTSVVQENIVAGSVTLLEVHGYWK